MGCHVKNKAYLNTYIYISICILHRKFDINIYVKLYIFIGTCTHNIHIIIYMYIYIFISLKDIIEAFYFKVFSCLFFNFVSIGKQPKKGVYWPKVRNKCYK